MLGIRTRGGRMGGADELTELRKHPFNIIFCQKSANTEDKNSIYFLALQGRLRQAYHCRARMGERPLLRHEVIRRQLRDHHGVPVQNLPSAGDTLLPPLCRHREWVRLHDAGPGCEGRTLCHCNLPDHDFQKAEIVSACKRDMFS